MTSHNTHITDYMVLEADSAEELSNAVVEAIHNRWQPFGNMAIVPKHDGSQERTVLLQPMILQAEWFR
ncbi:MAG: hypothetical protein ACU0CY_12195 [Maritimibacter harenae]|jgi:hypothetical protein|uniref:DUF1737 domain-containing protein n=1 Tax=Maritimibacter harenae TaxID=2606218 RepID=A0A845M8R6_9RHOB|nr:hypothetical protein [Maritimibacter harenae]MZR12711.1 hypothetical protein [Maritimibacter harenae]